MFEQFLIAVFYSVVFAEENMVRELFREPELSREEFADWGMFALEHRCSMFAENAPWDAYASGGREPASA